MITFLLLGALAGGTAAEVFVAPGGSDANPGTRAKPLATLQAAVDRAKGGTVRVRGGRYRLESSVRIGPAASGTTIAAYGSERPVFSGALLVPSKAFVPVRDSAVLERVVDPAARGRLRVADLRALGVSRFDPIQGRGFPQPVRPAPIELFADGKPQTLARWPNEGFATTGKVLRPGREKEGGSLVDAEGRPLQPSFVFPGDRLKRWTKARDAWLYGYWQFDWADESIAVSTIDPAEGTVTLAGPHCYPVAEGRPFTAENLLEEIDRPGEYYLDRLAGKLYLLPPAGFEKARVEVSLLAEPLVEVRDAKGVTMRGLRLETSRGDGVSIHGGERVRVEGCVLANLGGRGVTVEGGTGHGVLSCDIWGTGEGGVLLSGGDRATLTPSGQFVENCDIRDFSRRSQTYRPAVLIAGCGARVSHCRLHEAPHSAIIFNGNDHVIEFNEMDHVVRLTGDGGVVYTGRDWSARGNVVRFNYFHDNVGLKKWENDVYIDDQSGGMTIFGNVIVDSHWAMMIGGGRDNRIENNVIVGCTRAMHLDARGLGWAKGAYGLLKERLEAMPYQQPPWSTRYPELVGMLDREPMSPMNNRVRNNVLVRSGTVFDDIEAPFRKTATFQANLETAEDPGFVNMAKRDFALRKDSVVWRRAPGFRAIPFHEIGLRVDRYRKALPKR